MQNNEKNKQNFIKNLLAVAPKHCDNCGAKYLESDFKVIKSSSVNTVLHLRCKSCNNAYMLNVLNPASGMVGAQRTPVNIDLENKEELMKFAGKETVNRDEAIDIHEKLSSAMTEDALKKLIAQ